ncbi:TPA: hypothetical protein DDZ86_02560 [Candidatus Dependentiae bacterium]|nr:MAG: Folyl-polyglutamate synthase [candidate division TM6 bacterium GW2011_GWF2_43_87]HBL98501.1 hypothetical protein [Candidatus Dependentiae bacterium]
MDTSRIKRESREQSSTPLKQRNYQEVVAYLNEHWKTGDVNKTLERMTLLDCEFGSISKKRDAIIICGTNGKSLTAHFATKLLQSEGLAVGAFIAPHILTYNERITLNQAYIPNKSFTDFGNSVIDAVDRLGLSCNSSEILTMMSLLFFEEQKADVAVLESHEGGAHNPVNICNAKVVAITRVTPDKVGVTAEELKASLVEMVGVVKSGTHVVSGDQIKAHLQMMEDITVAQGGQWAMPIRKLSPLVYPFEQLHGRCAALAERIASLYMNSSVASDATIVNDSLLIKQKGQRGRPTLEAKRLARLNPKKTIDQFWKENINTLPSKFQLFDKEKPSVLLDSADNLDALENLLLGIRLFHYQRPIKGLTVIIGASKNTLHSEEFLKALRYFFKKTAGQAFVCPVDNSVTPGNGEDATWSVEHVVSDIKSKKMKATAFVSFAQAFEAAKATVDERHGLVVVTGSNAVIHEYWKYRGIKKLG